MHSLDDVFAALADPTRRAILIALTHGEATVGELAQPFAMTPRAVAKHIDVLHKAGLVDRRRLGRRTIASLRLGAMKNAQSWIEDWRSGWLDRFDNLSRHLAKKEAE
ncbi:helix-turn-helix transcriptional regulator [Sphingopyxis sp. JAI128]|uniref:ArsR/SmtB family transcription factor n=1 Tax=Sphingopyxis sp. JAI128 TaxID=2723066 RepID=UPI00161ACFEB|nr:metalloregulator ArsR/SmtB family transcription factor [Sphingopyxis sp. JAI128]MBB6426901.1 DNA-binding transcriptional ArsR family regulator [Sphingopyxis sp. JAI128]